MQQLQSNRDLLAFLGGRELSATNSGRRFPVMRDHDHEPQEQARPQKDFRRASSERRPQAKRTSHDFDHSGGGGKGDGSVKGVEIPSELTGR